MPRNRNLGPRVVVSARAREELLLPVLVETKNEIGGVLLGRVSDELIEVERCQQVIPVSSNEDEVDFDDRTLLRAAKIGKLMTGFERVGEWHSHPLPRLCQLFVTPLLSDADKPGIAVGEIELVVACCPWAGTANARIRTKDLQHVERIAGWCLKVEAWYRIQSKCKACPIVVLKG